jgi:hypothetical protein
MRPEERCKGAHETSSTRLLVNMQGKRNATHRVCHIN